jgi:hypothetical protein
VGFGVSVRLGDTCADPTHLLSLGFDGIDVKRTGDVAWFSAADTATLTVLAEPLTVWWQSFGPTLKGNATLRFVGPGGLNELTYCVPDSALEVVRNMIEFDSGRMYEPGEAPGRLRRFAAVVMRRFRTGFTASELVVHDGEGPLCVAVGGRQLDNSPRSIEFQAVDPEDGDEGYCIVDEQHIPVYDGLVSVRLRGRLLDVRVTRETAEAWQLRSARIPIKLRLSDPAIEQLRTGLQRVFATYAPPRLDL